MWLQIFSHLPYSDILSVRCTNKSWQKISQDEGLLKSVATRDFTWAPELIQYLPPYLEMTTETENRIYYYLDGQTLGLYKLCPDTSHERKAVYKQMNLEGTLDAPYIFCKNSTWKASFTMGSSNANFWNTTASPTTSTWVGIDSDDIMVLVRALAQMPPACAITLSCPRVPEDMTCPEVMGDYMATSHYISGRPVYKHVDRDLVLAVLPGPGDWMVRSVVDGDVGDAENTSKKYLLGPRALTSCLKQDDSMNDDDTNWWIWSEGRDLPELEVKCVTHGAAA